MYLFLYTMLLTGGGALAHFRGYTTRNLFVRDEPVNQVEEINFVECPVCNNTSLWPPLIENCEVNLNGKRYKQCKFGTYKNRVCGNRNDCKRGPGDKCSTFDNRDMYDLRCAPGYHCDGLEHRCIGGSNNPNPVNRYYLSPSSFSGSDYTRSTDLYNSREKRSAPYSFFAPH
ncbi:uncharacterized protein LOC113226705 [Hyposmocoma kahamanoa]|uniref:uncharacterized protein LOC113226705 n=1 Tax=Hyposmocoma kahamanoa TaxID=1477025 RepID=UPI000E6D6845|nr:uncharacterized protein LOC113226705 [Hyposmocoma kahamanoa]